MKLEYRILWFEDDHESVQDVVDALRGSLRKQGFELVCDWGECNATTMTKTVEQLRNYNPYDLMVFDYDLGSGLKGEDLAQTLRTKIWTEILYYSANRNSDALSLGMNARKVEGVFCAVRQNLEERIWALVESQIKRICDLNNMRGIVLDSMSSIDTAIRIFFSKTYEGMTDEKKSSMANKLAKKLEERAVQAKVFAEGISEETVASSILDHRYVDFQMVRQRLSHVNECFKDTSPMRDLQDLRNQLAHQPSRFNAQENVIGLIDQRTGTTEKFTYDRFTEIRVQLLAVRDALRTLGIDGV
jgi:hypothetical protein